LSNRMFWPHGQLDLTYAAQYSLTLADPSVISFNKKTHPKKEPGRYVLAAA